MFLVRHMEYIELYSCKHILSSAIQSHSPLSPPDPKMKGKNRTTHPFPIPHFVLHRHTNMITYRLISRADIGGIASYILYVCRWPVHLLACPEGATICYRWPDLTDNVTITQAIAQILKWLQRSLIRFPIVEYPWIGLLPAMSNLISVKD